MSDTTAKSSADKTSKTDEPARAQGPIVTAVFCHRGRSPGSCICPRIRAKTRDSVQCSIHERPTVPYEIRSHMSSQLAIARGMWRAAMPHRDINAYYA